MQCVGQHSQLPRHFRHGPPLVQQGLRLLFHLALEHRCRAPPRRLKKALRTAFPQPLHVSLHRFRRHVKRARNFGLAHRTVHHQLTGEQPESGQVLLRMLKHGQMPIQVGHSPVPAIKGQLGRNGSRTRREDRQLQLRHVPVLRRHNSLRKRNPGSIQFPRHPRNPWTRSGVLTGPSRTARPRRRNGSVQRDCGPGSNRRPNPSASVRRPCGRVPARLPGCPRRRAPSPAPSRRPDWKDPGSGPGRSPPRPNHHAPQPPADDISTLP